MRNVTGRPANRAGVRSTLKTVDRWKMTAEEEKIVLVAVVAVKEDWKAPDEVSRKTIPYSVWPLLFSHFGIKTRFFFTLKELSSKLFSKTGASSTRWWVAKDNPKQGNTLKLEAKVEFLGFLQIFVRGNGRFECFTCWHFHEKMRKSLYAETCSSVLSVFRYVQHVR